MRWSILVLNSFQKSKKSFSGNLKCSSRKMIREVSSQICQPSYSSFSKNSNPTKPFSGKSQLSSGKTSFRNARHAKWFQMISKSGSRITTAFTEEKNLFSNRSKKSIFQAINSRKQSMIWKLKGNKNWSSSRRILTCCLLSSSLCTGYLPKENFLSVNSWSSILSQVWSQKTSTNSWLKLSKKLFWKIENWFVKKSW